MKATTTSLCQAVTDRLLDGKKLAGELELTAHVGSCLDCFRWLTDVRELPRISEALRSEAAMATFGEDPGPAFWNAMPGQIADQIQAAQKTTAPARRPRARRWWAPATLMATGLAAVAVLVIYGATATRTVPVVVTRTIPATATRSAAISDEDLRALAEGGADDEAEGAMEQLASLDSVELERLTEVLGQELQ
jgi:hypothetical protein